MLNLLIFISKIISIKINRDYLYSNPENSRKTLSFLYASRASVGQPYGYSPPAYADLEAGARHLQTARRFKRDDDLLERG